MFGVFRMKKETAVNGKGNGINYGKNIVLGITQLLVCKHQSHITIRLFKWW